MKKLTVSLKDRSYPIIIERGLLTRLSELLPKKGRYFVITNTKVHSLYKEYLNCFENVVVIEDGEEFKNLETYKTITNKLLEARIERSDCIIALGGGVVGDLTGFVASTILRGVDFVQVPTTLLAQVDSSVGGKTGINHACGKNLIGTFYQPKMVLIDPNTLNTLDERQMRTGLGEVVKYAFIEKSCMADADSGFFDYLLLNDIGEIEDWENVIYTSCLLKAAVVAQDEREGGLRAILNFGHTFAHAVEKVSEYAYTHGEAVGMGIKMALKMAFHKKLIDKNYYDKGLALLDKFGLNIELDPKYTTDELLQAMKSDKKVSSGKISFVLPTKHSEVGLFPDIEEPLIKEILL